MEQHSIWREGIKLPSFPRLHGNIHTDVLIIGGGIAGILTAYFLQQSGISYVLVEKDCLCSGTTDDTTAKITAQHGLIYHKLLRSGGLETAQKYYTANKAACDRYASLCAEIDCGYEIKDNYVYSTNDRLVLEEELSALQKAGCPARFCENVRLPLRTAGAVKVPGQAQFHPLKLMRELCKGLNIYEHTFVREMIGNLAVTPDGTIEAGRVIVATHFPFINKHGSYFLKLYQHRSYVLALRGAQDVDGMYVDESRTGMSFRNYQDLLLLGGGGHRTGKQGGCWEELSAFARRVYSSACEVTRWAAQDCMSLDDIPYIGQYSARTHGLYVATGFNKWGMTGAMVAAMLLHDKILGKENDFADIFDPSRSMLKPQLLVNGLEATKNLLTPAPKRCPHLGCALKWNPAEHSWDCPCHGSRFAEDGRVLDNPANGNLYG